MALEDVSNCTNYLTGENQFVIDSYPTVVTSPYDSYQLNIALFSPAGHFNTNVLLKPPSDFPPNDMGFVIGYDASLPSGYCFRAMRRSDPSKEANVSYYWYLCKDKNGALYVPVGWQDFTDDPYVDDVGAYFFVYRPDDAETGDYEWRVMPIVW